MKRSAAFKDRFNILALLAVAALVTVSLIAQSNAAHYTDGDFYQRQTIWTVLGGALFVICAFVDLRLLERSSYIFYGVCLLLLLLTVFIGTEANNSRRWIRLGAFNIQASELTKLAVIMALARFFHNSKEVVPGGKEPHYGRYNLRQLVKPIGLTLLPLPLILIQPDLGTTMLILTVGLTMFLIEGMTGRSIVILFVTLLVAFPVAWKAGFIQEYQKDRVRLLVNMDWEKVDEETGNVIESRTTQGEQAVWAIGSGGFWGQGSRNAAKARIRVLPEVETDFIAAMVAEEQGFIGMMVLLFLFWFLAAWGFRTAHDCRTRYCTLLCSGIAAMIGWQVFINIGMVTGILPVVGLPLPFLSYGGSALLVMMASLGLMFNMAMKRGRL